MKQIWVVLALLAMGTFLLGVPIYKKLSVRPASASLIDRTKRAVEKNPQLQRDWEKAMEDGVLTRSEANAILQKAGEQTEPDD
jgi:hypothetical protein